MAWNNFDENNDLGALLGRREPVEEPQQEYVFEKTGEEQVENIEENIEEVQPKRSTPSKTKKNSRVNNVSAKLSDEENERLAKIMTAYGLTASKAVSECLNYYWEYRGEEVDKTAKKINKIRAQQ